MKIRKIIGAAPLLRAEDHRLLRLPAGQFSMVFRLFLLPFLVRFVLSSYCSSYAVPPSSPLSKDFL
jgi:hypothetical protein